MADENNVARMLQRINAALLGKDATDPKALGDAFLQVFPEGRGDQTAEEIGQELLDLQEALFEYHQEDNDAETK